MKHNKTGLNLYLIIKKMERIFYYYLQNTLQIGGMEAECVMDLMLELAFIGSNFCFRKCFI